MESFTASLRDERYLACAMQIALRENRIGVPVVRATIGDKLPSELIDKIMALVYQARVADIVDFHQCNCRLFSC
jgi:hypothetical protein